MKISILFTIIFNFSAILCFAQDSTTYSYPDSVVHKKNYKITYQRDPSTNAVDTTGGKTNKRYKITYSKKKPMYRPTRLGSSSPLYDTYKKNNKGAGAITTNPNKSAGSSPPVIIYKVKADSTFKEQPY